MAETTPFVQKSAFAHAKALQWVFITLTFLAMANCLKYVIRERVWSILLLEIIKDISVVIAGVYLYRKSHEEKSIALSFQMLLMISFISDWVVVLLVQAIAHL